MSSLADDQRGSRLRERSTTATHAASTPRPTTPNANFEANQTHPPMPPYEDVAEKNPAITPSTVQSRIRRQRVCFGGLAGGTASQKSPIQSSTRYRRLMGTESSRIRRTT